MSCHHQHKQTPKHAISIKHMPSLTDTHKQSSQAEPKSFEWAFLHPKYWGVWLAFALILPLIFLPLRWQFWIGKRLGILVHYLAKSRVQDTLTNL